MGCENCKTNRQCQIYRQGSVVYYTSQPVGMVHYLLHKQEKENRNMGKVKGMLDTANQKIMEGLMEAGLTEHEERLLDQVMKEEADKELAKNNKRFVQGFVNGVAFVVIVNVILILIK